MNKELIRREVAQAKAALSAEQRRAEAEAVWTRVEASEDFRAARTVLAYCSLPDELETESFLERWSGSKRLAVPVVEGSRLILKEYSPDKLHKGYKGISEPDAGCPQIGPEEIDFAIIPGVAFTREGWRLGRGKGFYDRLLPELNCPKVGVAYSCQILDSLPIEPHDARLSAVVSPA